MTTPQPQSEAESEPQPTSPFSADQRQRLQDAILAELKAVGMTDEHAVHRTALVKCRN